MSGDKELKPMDKIEKATVILTDIAGTTSSISFVKKTLFPFIVEKADEFLNKKWEDAEIKEVLDSLRKHDSTIVKDGDKADIIKSVVESIKTLTEKNSDVESFKKIQGIIAADGYSTGDLKGHIYPDVCAQLVQWTAAGGNKRVCVYSTGSIQSQKLLFANSTEGDLSMHIHEYFDQEIGAKTDSSSYKKILEKLKCTSDQTVFFTDLPAEAKAAKEAGIYSVLVQREENDETKTDDKNEYPVIKSFNELNIEASGKRKIAEEIETEAPPTKLAKTEVEVAVADKENNVAEKVTPPKEDEKMEVDSETKTEAVENNTTEVKKENANTSETVTEEAKAEENKEEKVQDEQIIKDAKVVSDEKITEKVESSDQSDKNESEKMDIKVEEKKNDSNEKTSEKETVTTTTQTKETEKEEKMAVDVAESEKPIVEDKEVVNNVISNSTEKTDVEPISKATETKTDTTKQEKTDLEKTAEENKTEPENKKDLKEITEKVEEKSETSNNEQKVDSSCEEKSKKTESETKDLNDKTDGEKKVADAEKTNAESAEQKPDTTSNKDEVDVCKKTVDNVEETKKIKEVENKPQTNDDEVKDKVTTNETAAGEEANKTTENGASEDNNKSSTPDDDTTKTSNSEEKENKSDLANGAAAHVENGDEKNQVAEEDAEIKVKKIDTEANEKPNVSVEVKSS